MVRLRSPQVVQAVPSIGGGRSKQRPYETQGEGRAGLKPAPTRRSVLAAW